VFFRFSVRGVVILCSCCLFVVVPPLFATLFIVCLRVLYVCSFVTCVSGVAVFCVCHVCCHVCFTPVMVVLLCKVFCVLCSTVPSDGVGGVRRMGGEGGGVGTRGVVKMTWCW